jgi:FdhD protein
MKGGAQASDEISGSSRDVLIKKVTGLNLHPAHDTLAVEEPLEIQLGYGTANARVAKSISVTMRTPGDDCSLAAGFLMTEGVVRDANDIKSIASWAERVPEVTEQVAANPGALSYHPGKNVVRVELAPDVVVSLATLERNFYTTSSCGICGKASLLALQTVCPPRMTNTFFISASILYLLPDRLLRAQRLFSRTGGLHGGRQRDSYLRLLRLLRSLSSFQTDSCTIQHLPGHPIELDHRL